MFGKGSFYLLDWFSARIVDLSRSVEKLCMNGAKAVQKLTGLIFLRSKRPTIPSGGRVDVIFAPPFA
jgi:hypothetical protein